MRKVTAVYCKTQTKDTDTPCGRNTEPLATKSWVPQYVGVRNGRKHGAS